MNDKNKFTPVFFQSQNIFQKAASDLHIQRIEAIVDELRSIGSPMAGAFADNPTLSLLAMLLQRTLRKIDEIFEFDGFVFSPACVIVLELFQARVSGIAISVGAVCQAVNASESVTRRWINLLETMNLVETTSNEIGAPKVVLTGRGYLKATEALKLLF